MLGLPPGVMMSVRVRMMYKNPSGAAVALVSTPWDHDARLDAFRLIRARRGIAMRDGHHTSRSETDSDPSMKS